MKDRKKVLVLGAGQVTKPMVDYFLDKCRYDVIMASRTVAKAIQIINGDRAHNFHHPGMRLWFPKDIGSSEAHGESPQPYQIHTSFLKNLNQRSNPSNKINIGGRKNAGN